MATDAQIAANRTNAQASCGPITAEGKARASRNALSSGLYSQADFVLPDEHAIYAEFCANFQSDLVPEGAVEQTLAAEIIHAAWRLRRCSAVEAGMTCEVDPMLDPETAKIQQAVDRARTQAHRAFNRAIAELRRLQTERQFRAEFLPEDFDTENLGLVSYKEIAPALRKLSRAEEQTSMDQAMNQMMAQINRPLPTLPPEKLGSFCARNAPCTCGSGIKYKRCCGVGTPAVLNHAA
jgi:hypothetical protein